MIFKNINHVIVEITMYSLKCVFQLQSLTNKRYKFITKCVTPNCPWRIYVSFVGGEKQLLQIKTYNLKHNCQRVKVNTDATLSWLCMEYLERFKKNPKMKVKEIREKHTLLRGYD